MGLVSSRELKEPPPGEQRSEPHAMELGEAPAGGSSLDMAGTLDEETIVEAALEATRSAAAVAAAFAAPDVALPTSNEHEFQGAETKAPTPAAFPTLHCGNGKSKTRAKNKRVVKGSIRGGSRGGVGGGGSGRAGNGVVVEKKQTGGLGRGKGTRGQSHKRGRQDLSDDVSDLTLEL